MYNFSCQVSHPELIPLLLFCEKLSPDEFILVDNLMPLPANSITLPETGASSPVNADLAIRLVDKVHRVEYPTMFNEVISQISVTAALKYLKSP